MRKGVRIKTGGSSRRELLLLLFLFLFLFLLHFREHVHVLYDILLKCF
jgi:hypothetical protein